MRVQNEGTGKSSWWMLNPDAKPGKSVRRRAASMETSKFEKRRGRAKKRVEALRNAQALGVAAVLNDATPSPSSSVSEGLDLFPDSPLHSGGFQLSPDFRQRASSNASSCGRLSPIPAVLGIEPDWGYPQDDFVPTTTASTTAATTTAQGSAQLDQLAGSLADDLTLQSEFMQGFNTATTQLHNQPPPPYQATQSYALHATVAQTYEDAAMFSMSPASGTGMSPSYPHSEPSPDPMGSYNSVIIGSRLAPRPSSSSPPLTPQTVPINNGDAPSTLMGQFMEALNNQAIIDDLGLNIDSFHGGLPNVDEVIKHELSMDGSLDFNFPISHHNMTTSHSSSVSTVTDSSIVNTLSGPSPQTAAAHAPVQYSTRTSVTPPSFNTATTQLHNQPPPPYQATQSYALHATVAQTYAMHQNQCPIHRMQPCSCMHHNNTRESMSPASGTGMSPSYPHSEPSPDPMGSYNSVIIGSRLAPRPSSSSPPLTPQTVPINNGDAPSTLMGQFMEALNNQAIIDDLGLNIDSFHGGLPNVDEVIKHELSMDGSLDFNFPISHHNMTTSHSSSVSTVTG
uniref:Uncharacterized protein n=2 Tax=Lutzomyia longipalpis TaxID=7200 RepID=A0A1B0GKI0_LUTLO